MVYPAMSHVSNPVQGEAPNLMVPFPPMTVNRIQILIGHRREKLNIPNALC